MDGLKSLLKSRKFWLIVTGLAGKFVAQHYGIEAEEASQILMGAVGLAVLIAAEDVAAKWKKEGDSREIDKKVQ
jgi:hypothetical protein